MSIFNDDLGFFAGHAMGQKNATDNAVDAINRVHANYAAKENEEKMRQRDGMINQIQQMRADNLMRMAEYEYDVHVKNDVSKRIRVAGETLADWAQNGAPEKETIQLLSDNLMGAREIHWEKEREEWINARFKELQTHVKFPTNDMEAISTGGYAMPKVETIPPYLEYDKEGLANNTRTWAEVDRVLVIPAYSEEVLPRMQRGGVKLG